MVKHLFCLLAGILCLFSTVSAQKNEAVSMVDYEQEYTSSTASIALRNNTGNTITHLSFTLVYLDMEGHQLDYKDFDIDTEIRSGLTKKVDVKSYGHNFNYEYYKTSANPYKPKLFKLKYSLNDYSPRDGSFDNKVNDDALAENIDQETIIPEESDDEIIAHSHRSIGETPDDVMLVILITMFICLSVNTALYVIVGVMAQKRNRSVIGWVAISIFLSPLITILVLLIAGRKHSVEEYIEQRK